MASVPNGTTTGGPKTQNRCIHFLCRTWLANEEAVSLSIVRHQSACFNFRRTTRHAVSRSQRRTVPPHFEDVVCDPRRMPSVNSLHTIRREPSPDKSGSRKCDSAECCSHSDRYLDGPRDFSVIKK